ncbi:MAG: pyruvate kinase [Anaerolineae bacterium]|nr:pyruvate kinase [Anaerolineae bacterium]MCO5186790.1 pyruvate kinase [Anaerolineae bacterium]MCO5194011.1 pyruvate kinase [Anaerolineae bacterium]
MPRSKIVATIGPASDSAEMLRRMMMAGMDVARLNFSHGEHETHAAVFQRIRAVAAELGKTVAILADLQGPKLRLGDIADGELQLEIGQLLELSHDVENSDAIPFPHPELWGVIKPGARLVIGDGEMELRVMDKDATRLVCSAALSGALGSRKGVNLPGTTLPIPSITDKDRRDLEFVCKLGVDFVAMSFVRSAQDVLELRYLMRHFGNEIPIIAKIEKSEAVACLHEIREVADGMMVARGDLGIDLPAQEVPFLQKKIIEACNEVGKPVITATQMLQSMVDHPRPTRAEASDVANAILDGSDAIMLSGETASGKYPVEAIMTMRSIAKVTRLHFPWEQWVELRRERVKHTPDITNAISASTCAIAARVEAKAIVTTTMSGRTARFISRNRPETPIIAVTPLETTARRMALQWGVESLIVPNFHSTDDMIAGTIAAVCRNGLEVGDKIVITGGVPFNVTGLTNFAKVHEIGAQDIEALG